MSRNIPVAHKDSFTIHQAEAQAYDYLEDYVAVREAQAVKAYIEKKKIEDSAGLDGAERSIRYRQKCLDKAAQLSSDLTSINEGFHLTEAVKNAGAANPDLTIDVIRQEHEIEISDGYGGHMNVTIDGRTAQDFLRDFSKNPEYSMLFDKQKAMEQSQKNKALQTYGQNPWMPETFNLTRQGQIFREDPELARKMAAAAGKKI